MIRKHRERDSRDKKTKARQKEGDEKGKVGAADFAVFLSSF